MVPARMDRMVLNGWDHVLDLLAALAFPAEDLRAESE